MGARMGGQVLKILLKHTGKGSVVTLNRTTTDADAEKTAYFVEYNGIQIFISLNIEHAMESFLTLTNGMA